MTKATPTIMLLGGLLACPAVGQWVSYDNETSVRMPTPPNDPALSTSDSEEKDYAWGDVDRDGDIDLVVVRKQPFTSAGRKINVFFMNEGIDEGHAVNGVLVDRTAEYATAADDGGNGFFDTTNDRDVVLVDLDGDDWLDMVTATTISDGLPKTISHPRVYMNLAEVDGVWQGFEYQEQRIPQLVTAAGLDVAPRFCSVAAGDVTGDGAPDLYFGDYDGSGAGGAGQPPEFDLNNRLLVNDGSGFFSDETAARLTDTMSRSAFGAASVIADMNGNGVNDIVKQTSLSSPTHVAVTYNDDAGTGFFDFYQTVYSEAPYFVSVDDLNGDGRLDMVIVDDGTDRYMLNQGNDGSGHVIWQERAFSSSASAGFGGNSFIADLNNDGHNDVLITDVDVDISGCSRRMHIYRNLGDTPDVSLQEQGEIIPNSMLNGTHDVAVFDLNNDGWLDLVIGRCNTTEVWMNQPPTGIVFSYPLGLSAFVTPGEETTFQVALEAIGGVKTAPDSGSLFYSIEGGAYTEVAMSALGDDLYEATLPALTCTQQIDYYVAAELSTGEVFTDPPTAPAVTHQSIAADGTEITFRDEIEGDVSSWIVENDPGLLSGAWEAAEPIGTISGASQAAPDMDATAGVDNVMAFVTQNGLPGGTAGQADVDGGPTWLTSPALDLAGTDGVITYSRWFFSSEAGVPGNEDFLTIEVSGNDGVDWVHIEDIGGTEGEWESASFVVSDYVVPSAEVRVRFSTSDGTSAPSSSIVEAGIDNLQVETFVCGTEPCPADLDGSGDVGFADLLSVLSAWGPCTGTCAQDLDGSGDVG
ncbi:MAG: VCBS repeat-containing protein, partial [Phycisphaerae bacterium]|nr:VCBS repeat-containing protein [Phycisphaerae bacterium]